MENVVVDSCVLVASFITSERHHQQASDLIDGLDAGDYNFHLPMLAVVEASAAISRRQLPNGLALLARAKLSLTQWEQMGKLHLYPIDRNRMDTATSMAERLRLRGSDAVLSGLAEEMGIPLKTYDQQVLERFPRASL